MEHKEEEFEIAKRYLWLAMSEHTQEHIDKIEYLNGWIVSAMIEYKRNAMPDILTDKYINDHFKEVQNTTDSA